jgi:hypothetical protein
MFWQVRIAEAFYIMGWMGSGVLAHGSIWFLYSEMQLRNILKYQKIEKRFTRTCSRATRP